MITHTRRARQHAAYNIRCLTNNTSRKKRFNCTHLILQWGPYRVISILWGPRPNLVQRNNIFFQARFASGASTMARSQSCRTYIYIYLLYLLPCVGLLWRSARQRCYSNECVQKKRKNAYFCTTYNFIVISKTRRRSEKLIINGFIPRPFIATSTTSTKKQLQQNRRRPPFIRYNGVDLKN